MEEAAQQISQKPPFPIKTKIVAWLIIVISIIVASYVLKVLAKEILLGKHTVGIDVLVYIILPPSLIHLFLFTFILKRKRWAWWLGILVLFIMIFISGLSIFSSFDRYNLRIQHSGGYAFVEEHAFKKFKSELSFSVILFSIVVFSFILLLLDRKNFWKIAT